MLLFSALRPPQPLQFSWSVLTQMPLLLIDQFVGFSASLWTMFQP